MRSRVLRIETLVIATLVCAMAGCSAVDDRAVSSSTGVPPSTSSPATGSTTTAGSTAERSLAEQVEAQLRTYSFFDHVRAVLVEVDGELVVEQYFGSDATTSRNAFSVTKSVLSTLVGIAVDEGVLPGLDADLTTLLPERTTAMSPQVAAITLRQLLTMTSGLPDDFDTGMTFAEEPDWVARILEDGTDHPAGEFAYGDANPHLVAAALTRATGGTIVEYATTRLFEPLGITTAGAPEVRYTPEGVQAYEQAGFAWPIDPQGVNVGATDLKLTPRDMLALGRLYLNDGRVGDRQVVPADWIGEATSEKTPTDDARGYGYYWWTSTADGEPAAAAVGYGGQLIEVIPSLGTVVVVSSDLQEAGDPVPPVDSGELMNSLVSGVIAAGLNG